MGAAITQQQLEEASVDAETLERAASGVPQIVQPRVGPPYRNAAQLLLDIEATADGDRIVGAAADVLNALKDYGKGSLTRGALFQSFRSDLDNGLDLFVTPDFVNLYRINADTIFRPGELRDPSMALHPNGYLYGLSSIGFSNPNCYLFRTHSLWTGYEVLRQINWQRDGARKVDKIWAPSFFIDPKTGDWYAEGALGYNTQFDDQGRPIADTHEMAYIKFSADMATNTQPVSFGFSKNYIDGETYFDDVLNLYGHFVKQEDPNTKWIELWTSPSYPNPGGWTLEKEGDWMGLKGTKPSVEGPTLFKDDKALIHCYVDSNETGEYFTVAADTIRGPWSARQTVNLNGATMRHAFATSLDNPTIRERVIEAVAMFGITRIATLPGSGVRPAKAIPASAYQGNWSQSSPVSIDQIPQIGYAKLAGEVSCSSQPSSGASATVLRLPIANAGFERFECQARAPDGTRGTARMLLFQGFLIWEAGPFTNINLSPVFYAMDGFVSGLNGG